MLAKHLRKKKDTEEIRGSFRFWQKKLLKRIRLRMFFVKFVEIRSAKKGAIEAFKESKRNTEKVERMEIKERRRVVK